MLVRHPFWAVSALVVIALLTSAFGTELGTQGIVIIVGGTFAFIVLAPMVWRAFMRYVTTHTGPSRMDWMIAPSGYRPSPLLPKTAQSRTGAIPLAPSMADLPRKEQYETAAKPVPTQRIARSITTIVDEEYLDLSDDLQPPLRLVIGRAILCVGRRGMGKSAFGGRFVEQMGQYPLPMLVCDYEQDYASVVEVLPRAALGMYPSWREGQRYLHAYGERVWGVSLENAEQVGRLILQEGVQLILQTSSFPSLEMAAQVMVAIIDGMFEWAEERDPEKRVPALILADEAQHFFPQSFGSMSINRAESMELLRAFQRINSIGRKRGFTPAIFGTRIAQINNEVIAGSEIYFLFGTSFPADLNRYRDIIGKKYYSQDAVNALGKGDVLVYEGGNAPFSVHMKERVSEHRNITPQLHHAQQRYGTRLPNFSLVSFGQETPEQETPEEFPVTYYHASTMEEQAPEDEEDEEQRVEEPAVPEQSDPTEGFLRKILQDYQDHPFDHGIHAIARRQTTTPHYVRMAFAMLRKRGDLPSSTRMKLSV